MCQTLPAYAQPCHRHSVHILIVSICASNMRSVMCTRFPPLLPTTGSGCPAFQRLSHPGLAPAPLNLHTLPLSTQLLRRHLEHQQLPAAAAAALPTSGLPAGAANAASAGGCAAAAAGASVAVRRPQSQSQPQPSRWWHASISHRIGAAPRTHIAASPAPTSITLPATLCTSATPSVTLRASRKRSKLPRLRV